MQSHETTAASCHLYTREECSTERDKVQRNLHNSAIRQGMGLNLFKIFTLLASSKLLIIFKWQPVTKIIAFYFNHELDFFPKPGLF